MDGGGGGGSLGVREECISHCSQLQQTAPVASTPLPVLTGFTFSHSQTGKQLSFTAASSQNWMFAKRDRTINSFPAFWGAVANKLQKKSFWGRSHKSAVGNSTIHMGWPIPLITECSREHQALDCHARRCLQCTKCADLNDKAATSTQCCGRFSFLRYCDLLCR